MRPVFLQVSLRSWPKPRGPILQVIIVSPQAINLSSRRNTVNVSRSIGFGRVF